MHALVAAVLLRLTGLDALDGDPEPEPPDGEPGDIEEAVGAGKRHAVVGPDRLGQAALLEELFEGRNGEVLAGRFERLAEQEEARGVVGDGERVAIAAVAELELAFEVGAPEVVRRRPNRERRSGCTMTRPARYLDQPVPMQDGVDRALGRNADIAIQPPDQELADTRVKPEHKPCVRPSAACRAWPRRSCSRSGLASWLA